MMGPGRAFRQLVQLLRSLVYGLRFLGRPVRIHSSSWVSRRSVVRVLGGGSITIGRNCEIHPFSMLMTYGGHITIGDDCSVNPFATIYGHGGVRIGNGVRIATQTVIIPANHDTEGLAGAAAPGAVTGKGISIADHVWLGAGTRILDGVHIGRNAIVGAGSVVTEEVAENTTVAGVPARVIKRREGAN